MWVCQPTRSQYLSHVIHIDQSQAELQARRGPMEAPKSEADLGAPWGKSTNQSPFHEIHINLSQAADHRGHHRQSRGGEGRREGDTQVSSQDQRDILHDD